MAACPDLLQFYASHFRPGAIDLSASGPPPLPMEPFADPILRGPELAFVPPRGAPELREAIASRYERLGADDVVLSAGASEALVALAFATLRRWDVAWVGGWAYPSFAHAASRIGALLKCGARPTRGQRVALVCNPTVPDGRLVGVGELAEEARRAGATLLVDEVYRDFREGTPAAAAADVDPSAVSIGDLTKPLGLGGVRIGWIASRNRAVLDAADRALQLLSGGPASLSARAALAGFDDYDASVSATMECAGANHAGTVGVLGGHGWKIAPRDAGLTMLARPPAPVAEAQLRAISDAGFFLLPTDVFGVPGGFRISLLRDAETVERALAVLECEAIRG